MGVVPLLLFFIEASINTFLDLALDFFNLFLWSGIGTTPHSRLLNFKFQFQVHLDQFFTREGGRQGAEYLLIGYQQFPQSGVKVKTLKFLQEILPRMANLLLLRSPVKGNCCTVMNMKKLCLVIQNNCTSVSSIIWKRFVSASSVLPMRG